MINQFVPKIINEISKIDTEHELMNLKSKYLGKNGEFTIFTNSIKDLSIEEKKKQGPIINSIKKEIESIIADKFKNLRRLAIDKKLAEEKIDISLPSKGSSNGSIHPLSIVSEEIVQIFTQFGFEVFEGPEIESDHYNFEALNIPKDHPARDMQDTFYLGEGNLLRTHTSPMQVRIMESNDPPIKIISPGKVYRCDSDVTHTPMFHQIEGLLVDKSITFANLKGVLNEFISRFFGDNIKTRFRPSYFPFTEPSAELDIEWKDKNGSKAWMEVLGCGMVNPKVFESVNYNSDDYTGLAFGMGIERLAMIKFGITDIRYFYQNDIKFLKQF
ncbi:phenylalanine--tRNA ligase subunit alpha [bacterium]|jgi:phenylalanyl-tRNA synthetase alpha chain|nr:phenylalanine--tRNA ligase subunit alpha [bacterium]MDG2005883.1 phenylalanine--tRNA ligase subunit alpha [Thermodesulfobacteriota bacterium]